VRDTGPGIQVNDRERIFEPFVQLATQPASDSGTGLGLAICKQNVELMGGHIDVTSGPGAGSVFYFEIPVTVLPVGTILAETPHGRVIGLEDGQPRHRLLIAEDHPDNRLLLHDLLEPLGFDVREAANGQQAVDICERWHPDLIWMDVRMPVMDGREATRLIRRLESGAHTKIIALTAHALEEERREILECGCDDFVQKPYRESEIFDVLAKHLRIRFRYAGDSPTIADEMPYELSAARLSQLPRELVDELLRAARLLERRRILEVISHINRIDHDLSERLRRMAEDLRYRELLRVLDAVAEKRGS
jgi:Amt family ammonium transporter